MNNIDKPIEPTRHYFLFQDASADVIGMFANTGGLFAMPDRYVEKCPSGYSQSHITELINPPDTKCYPDNGSD